MIPQFQRDLTQSNQRALFDGYSRNAYGNDLPMVLTELCRMYFNEMIYWSIKDLDTLKAMVKFGGNEGKYIIKPAKRLCKNPWNNNYNDTIHNELWFDEEFKYQNLLTQNFVKSFQKYDLTFGLTLVPFRNEYIRLRLFYDGLINNVQLYCELNCIYNNKIQIKTKSIGG
eukprot:4450_1